MRYPLFMPDGAGRYVEVRDRGALVDTFLDYLGRKAPGALVIIHDNFESEIEEMIDRGMTARAVVAQ